MKVALFCHAEGEPSEIDVRQELSRQYALLDSYARRQGFFIEHTAFHTGGFCLEPPDRILLALLQHACAKEFDMTLVCSKAHFPLLRQTCLPPIQLYFLREAQRLSLGSSETAVFQQLQALPDKAEVYWR